MDLVSRGECPRFDTLDIGCYDCAGGIVLVHQFFALLSIPHLSKLQDKYKDVDVTIIGSTNEKDEQVPLDPLSFGAVVGLLDFRLTLLSWGHLSENPGLCE